MLFLAHRVYGSARYYAAKYQRTHEYISETSSVSAVFTLFTVSSLTFLG